MIRTSSLLCLLFILLLAACTRPADATPPQTGKGGGQGEVASMAFWDRPQRGGNSMNLTPPDRAYFDALRAAGATWVRLSADKWPSADRDFLIGNADDYAGLNQADLATLRRVLDDAHAAGLKVVLAPLSLPLLRWRQLNHGTVDARLWASKEAQQPAQAFWRDLAAALKGHPAVAAYNLINEPAPERGAGLAEHASVRLMQRWYAGAAGGPRDIRLFYAGLLAAVRQVDPVVPVMLDAGWYAAADAFRYWPAAMEDPNVLYAVHMYEPYDATSAPNLKRDRPWRYPGHLPFAGATADWDAARVAAYLQQPIDWAKAMGVPRSRVVVGEFGCMRRWADCPTYLRDVLAVLQQEKLHWAFYAFREDGWEGMDYELGDGPLPWAYWQAAEQGDTPVPPRDSNAPLFRQLREAMRAGQTE